MKNAYTSHQELTTIINEVKDYKKSRKYTQKQIRFFRKLAKQLETLCERLQNIMKAEEKNECIKKDNLKISYEIKEILDQIKEIKQPYSFFSTNQSQYISTTIKSKNKLIQLDTLLFNFRNNMGDTGGKNDLSVAEKSLISNIKIGYDFPRTNQSQIGANDYQVYMISQNAQLKYTISNLKNLQIDMNKLSPDQQEEVAYYIQQIARLDSEQKQIKTLYIKTVQKQFEEQRKAIEILEFFIESIKACEKNILKSHKINQFNWDDGQIFISIQNNFIFQTNNYDRLSSSFFFELKRKKFQ